MVIVSSLFVPHLSFFWCLGKVVLCDCNIPLVSSHILTFHVNFQVGKQFAWNIKPYFLWKKPPKNNYLKEPSTTDIILKFHVNFHLGKQFARNIMPYFLWTVLYRKWPLAPLSLPSPTPSPCPPPLSPWDRGIFYPRDIIWTILVEAHLRWSYITNIKGLDLLVSEKIFKVFPNTSLCKTWQLPAKNIFQNDVDYTIGHHENMPI